jgi:arsenite-transporting ATPase
LVDTAYATSTGERKVIMFAGKGGVGKTTCAVATALHFASVGKRTLVVSTDPTPSLSHILEIKRNQEPIEITADLHLEEIGVDQVKQMWNRKFGREVYEVFASFVDIDYTEFVDFVTDVLPGMRDEFMVDYIRELTENNDYDIVIWDTAPLGQTLGLLTMPAMLSEHLKMAPRIYSRLKIGSYGKRSVLDIIKGWEELSAIDMEFLRTRVDFVIVTIPESLAVEQLDGIFVEFGKHQMELKRLIINNVIIEKSGEFLIAKAKQQQQYIEMLQRHYPELEKVELPMFPVEIKGIDRLYDISRYLYKSTG